MKSTVDKLAKSIAYDRAVMDVKRNFVVELEGKADPGAIRRALYTDEKPFLFTAGEVKDDIYFEQLPERLMSLDKNPVAATSSDILAAQAVVFTDENSASDKPLSQAMLTATQYEAKSEADGHALNKDRQNILKDIENASDLDRKEFSKQSPALLSRLYKSFTRTEITALAQPQSVGLASLTPLTFNQEQHSKSVGRLENADINALDAPLHHSMDFEKLSRERTLDRELNLNSPKMEM